MQDAASQLPKKGYQDHHIVEQAAGRRDGFSDAQIESRDNVVRIPTLKHYEINGWYGRREKEFGGQSPREYLRGKTWEERMHIGRRALVDHGVLKP